MNEQQATLLLTCMRNSPVVLAFKKALVKAFWEMAKQIDAASPSVPQSLPEALRLAADLAERKAEVEAQLALAAPKVAALGRIAEADGSMCVTAAAKHLQMQPKALFQWLNQHGWIYRRPGSHWLAYQHRILAGVLEHKVETVERSDGSEKIVEQVRVTAKGLAKLAEDLSHKEAA